MKSIRFHVVIGFMGILLLAAGAIPSLADADGISWSIFHKDAGYFKKVQSDPRDLVEEYCGSEYNGVQDIRLKVVKLGRGKNASGRGSASGTAGSAGKFLDFGNDPLIVVDSYQIKSVEVSEGHAEATVVYKRLANCDVTEKRKYVVDRNSRDTVRLSLDFDGSLWWIVDPPLPRVSKWALIEYSERIISSMNGLVKAGKASDGQKRYYQAYKGIVAFLKGL
jgi:hypothetical protein